MSFHATDRWGAAIRRPSEHQMRELLDSLAIVDIEHPDVSLTHESGWSLSAFSSGLLAWENIEGDDSPRHMNGVTRERMLTLWRALAAGNLSQVEQDDWHAGYGDQASA